MSGSLTIDTSPTSSLLSNTLAPSDAQTKVWDSALSSAAPLSMNAAVNNQASALPPPPLLPKDQIEQIQKVATENFLKDASSAPNGSDLKITYNLYQVLAIEAQVNQLKNHVNTTLAENDLRTYLQKSDVQGALHALVNVEVFKATGKSGDAVAQDLAHWLLSNTAKIEQFRHTNPNATMSLVNDVVGQIYFLSPQYAKQVLTQYIKSIADPSNVFEALANTDPASLTSAAQNVFQIGITEARFGLGSVSQSFSTLSKLTPAQLNLAASTFASAFRAAAMQNASPAAFASLLAHLQVANIGPNIKNALISFAKSLNATGTLGTIAGALAGVAVYQDFSGNGSATTGTAWGRVVTAADVLNVLGAGGALYKSVNALTSFFTNVDTIGRFRTIFSSGNPLPRIASALQGVNLSSEPAVERALSAIFVEQDRVRNVSSCISTLVDQGMPQTVMRRALSAGNLAAIDPDFEAWLDTLNVARDIIPYVPASSVRAAEVELQQLGESEGQTALSEELSIATSEGAADATATGLTVGQGILTGLGALGSVANILYGANALNNSISDFEKGYAAKGALDVVAVGGFWTSSVAGLGAAVAETAAAYGAEGALIGAFSGPTAPIVAAVAALVGAGAAIGGYFLGHDEAHDQIKALENLLKSGVGTGHNYYV